MNFMAFLLHLLVVHLCATEYMQGSDNLQEEAGAGLAVGLSGQASTASLPTEPSFRTNQN